MSCLPRYRAAQHAAGADAAARRQDRGYFDSWYQLGGFPDLLGGAAERQAVRWQCNIVRSCPVQTISADTPLLVLCCPWHI